MHQYFVNGIKYKYERYVYPLMVFDDILFYYLHKIKKLYESTFNGMNKNNLSLNFELKSFQTIVLFNNNPTFTKLKIILQ